MKWTQWSFFYFIHWTGFQLPLHYVCQVMGQDGLKREIYRLVIRNEYPNRLCITQGSGAQRRLRTELWWRDPGGEKED